jgi:hypothetical protein
MFARLVQPILLSIQIVTVVMQALHVSLAQLLIVSFVYQLMYAKTVIPYILSLTMPALSVQLIIASPAIT